MPSAPIYEIEITDINGQVRTMSEFAGKVLLIVNTASKCGLTPQYQGLQKLYDELAPQGFEALGFPCNQFLNQEPGDSDQIREFCSLNYDVRFPMFAKVEVNGPGTHPLFELLKSEAPGLLGSKQVKWNFTKFLVGRDGKVIRRYSPRVEPEAIRKDIMELL